MNLEWMKFWKKKVPAPTPEPDTGWWISLPKAQEVFSARLDELEKDFAATESAAFRAKIIARKTEVLAWLTWLNENAEK